MYDHKKMAKSIKLFLEAIGEDTKRAGILETPERCARMYKFIMNGYDDDPKRHLKFFYELIDDDIVVLANVPFYSFCEHHLILFTGVFHVGYIPDRRVRKDVGIKNYPKTYEYEHKLLGMSKFIRIMRCFAKRPQMQERLTKQVAHFLANNVSANVIVRTEATHFCCSMRGVRAPGVTAIKESARGKFKDKEWYDKFDTKIRDRKEFRY